MNQDPNSESKGWWQTLPGLLTAGAGIITALSGLLLALHQTGCFARGTQPATQLQSESQPVGESSKPIEGANAVRSSQAGVTAPRLLPLPDGAEVHSGQAVYKLLSARLEAYSPDKVSLHLTIRMTNNDRFDANFWAASFRLLVDGSLQAPTNNLDELAAGHSSKEGEVEFVIPASVSTVGLQMGDVGEGKPTIPINLQNPQR